MAEKLKDKLYSTEIIGEIADQITRIYSEFDRDKFLQLVFSANWDELELKQRMRRITECLHDTFPSNYEEAIPIMKKASPQVNGLIALSFSDYVECYGQHNWELSMTALAHFTKSCSSEFAVRPFLDQNPNQGMEQMNQWAADDNEHVRRLSSEGCRPRLPWGMALQKFKKDPSLILPILEKLKDDPSDYVRKSVANNLNDISKDHPELVLEICKRWQGHSANTDRIIKHACRTMLKSGNKQAMLLFGFGDPQKVEVNSFIAERAELQIGEKTQLNFELTVNEKKSKKIRLEYQVHFIKANGKASPKVFQISEKMLKPGVHRLQFKHDFQNQSTRKHFPGKHRFELIINGESKAETTILITPTN